MLSVIIKTTKFFISLLLHKFNSFSINITSMMLGYFIASILSTLPAQTGDWGIIGAAIIVTINEITSKNFYSLQIKKNNVPVNFSNYLRIGIIYGIFIDAFKLGS